MSDTKYVITVEKKSIKTVVVDGEYKILKTNYLNEAQYNSLNMRDQMNWKRTSNDPVQYECNVSGYAPKTEKEIEITTEIFKQVVSSLSIADLSAVINKSNKVALKCN